MTTCVELLLLRICTCKAFMVKRTASRTSSLSNGSSSVLYYGRLYVEVFFLASVLLHCLMQNMAAISMYFPGVQPLAFNCCLHSMENAVVATGRVPVVLTSMSPTRSMVWLTASWKRASSNSLQPPCWRSSHVLHYREVTQNLID